MATNDTFGQNGQWSFSEVEHLVQLAKVIIIKWGILPIDLPIDLPITTYLSTYIPTYNLLIYLLQPTYML
jgi:hypothetical protein